MGSGCAFSTPLRIVVGDWSAIKLLENWSIQLTSMVMLLCIKIETFDTCIINALIVYRDLYAVHVLLHIDKYC